jgi:uncharacterized protein YukE
MTVLVKKLKKELDQIMRRLRVGEKKVEEADNKNMETVYKIEIEM